MGVAMVRDAAGGEVRVEYGVGAIIAIEPKGDRNVLIKIRAPHLREDLVCWVDRQGPVWPRVEWAKDHPNHSLWYRIDVHRKAKVGPEKSIAELANRDKVRDLVGLEKPENAPQTIAGAAAAGPAYLPPSLPSADPPPAAQPQRAAVGPARAVTPPARAEEQPPPLDEPPPDDGPPPEAEPPIDDAVRVTSLTNALKHLAEALSSGKPPEEVSFLIEVATDLGATKEQLDAAGDRARAARAQAAVRSALPRDTLDAARDPDRIAQRAPNPPVADPPAQPGAPRPAVSPTSGLGRRASQPAGVAGVATDERPWIATNSDGRLNLSSYAAGAVMEFVNLAGRLLVIRARQRHQEDPSYVIHAPTPQQIFGLAWQLMNVADTVQNRMRQGGRVDRMASSHKLARQAVREGLDLYPVPWGGEADVRVAWKAGLTEHALNLVNVMLDILENRDRPSVAQPPPAAAEQDVA